MKCVIDTSGGYFHESHYSVCVCVSETQPVHRSLIAKIGVIVLVMVAGCSLEVSLDFVTDCVSENDLWCSQAPHQPGQPGFKFTVAESCDRIKDEFQFLQAQYHR